MKGLLIINKMTIVVINSVTDVVVVVVDFEESVLIYLYFLDL